MLWLATLTANAQRQTVIADSVSHEPLAGVTVFDRFGRAAGMSNREGIMTYVSPAAYPVTIRHIGFKERCVTIPGADTVFLAENFTELPEVVFIADNRKLLHILAYVREYSTLTTVTDTVFLFREKMVDYMLPPEKGKSRSLSWTSPRPLKSRSYYHFTDSRGLDSVSSEGGLHFSWSDWIGFPPLEHLPAGIDVPVTGTDTVTGRYGTSEIWTRTDDRLRVSFDILADTIMRRRVPGLTSFFRDDMEFEKFRLNYNYANVTGDSVTPRDLTGYSIDIESQGRGRKMFKFNKVNESFYVNTYAEVYILDKEYVDRKQAGRWQRLKTSEADIEIIEPAEAPELQDAVKQLTERVEAVDKNAVRLAFVPPYRPPERRRSRSNVATRALDILKGLTGITAVRSRRKLNKHWREFTNQQIEHNTDNIEHKKD